MQSNAKKSLINMSILLPLHIFQILLNFVLKTVFIKTMGSDYLGVNVLFGDIATLLSLTELGLNNAILFELYKPIRFKDKRKISAVINYSKKIFNMIALVILISGLLLIPGLKHVINSNIEYNSIIWYYFLYLITVAVTYLSTYKTVLITADEKNYITKCYYTLCNTIKVILQSIVLIVFKNFTMFLIIGIFTNVLFNILISRKVEKDYKFLDKTEKLESGEKKKIFNNTKAVFKYKISGLILNNTDNIIISTILTTDIVGQYSGYTTLYTTMIGLLNNFYASIVNSIGKLNIVESSDQKEKTFNLINLFMFILASITSICFFCLADDFIILWIGPEYIMGREILIAIVLNFYISIIMYPLQIYRETTELFIKTQNIALFTSIANIVLSVLLAKIYGLFGILFATSISKLITSFWAEPILLYKNHFNHINGCLSYFKNIAIGFTMTVGIGFFVRFTSSSIEITNFGLLFLKGFVCLLTSSCCVISLLTLNKDFRMIIFKIFKKIKK